MIADAQIKFYKPSNVSDTSQNGGRMSPDSVTDGLKNNVWPSVTKAQRTAGVTQYRKVFIKVENNADPNVTKNQIALTPSVFIAFQTPGQDCVSIFPATQNDTQADITGAESLYGTGLLNAGVGSGATQIVVGTEGTAFNHFRNGMTIRIHNMSSPDDATGIVSEITLATSNAVSWNGDVATLTLSAPLAQSWLAEETRSINGVPTLVKTRVCGVIRPADIQAVYDSTGISSAGGTFTFNATNLLVDHTGGIEQAWTLQFTSPTQYDVIGDTLGNIDWGNITSDKILMNPDFPGNPYFTLLAAGFGGTWQIGDTITFTTHPSAYPVWEKRVVPAACAALSSDEVIIEMEIESD
ncbi:MAG: hypothetical protein HQK86_03230 [Nitrospinae bacterium]|nr:hypothetical protein [Nitrospinota bacterium]